MFDIRYYAMIAEYEMFLENLHDFSKSKILNSYSISFQDYYNEAINLIMWKYKLDEDLLVNVNHYGLDRKYYFGKISFDAMTMYITNNCKKYNMSHTYI
jgi:hypothetical protein